MSSFVLRRLTLVLLACVVATPLGVALTAGTASAHNELVSSDPQDGAVLTTAPTQIVWTFKSDVPLDTMTVTLIDSTMARSELSGSVHGPNGRTEVVTPLPPLADGEISVRWRLVSADGHAVTGRVDLTIATGAAAPGTGTPATTVPAGTVTEPPTSTVDEGEPASTSSALRWLLRYGSYLAIMTVVGILLVSAWVWADAAAYPLLRRLLSGSLLAVAALAAVQLLVVASDVTGSSLWSSLDAVDAAITIDAGRALAIRIALALGLWVVLFRQSIGNREVYWTAVSIPALGLLATWAFAGHASSMRWPVLGVTTDVIHHAAAALWVAGLAVVAWIVIPSQSSSVVSSVVRAFSRVAAICVAVLVVTGLLQSLRLVGTPTDLLSGNHGRLLAVKVLALVAMLFIARANRRRIEGTIADDDALTPQLPVLRRAVFAEFAIGLVIIGLTAAMVVSPPATSIS